MQLMEAEWRTIVITLPDMQRGEADKIVQLLTCGAADRVHIRKPGVEADSVERLLKAIPHNLHHRLSLHGFREVAKAFEGVSVHAPDGDSASLHTLDEVDTLSAGYDYVTLSPVYDSISKRGYRSAFALSEVTPHIAGRNVIALGGVTPAKFPELKRAGFAGAALLGYVWHTPDNLWPAMLADLRKARLLARCFGLQFITNAPDVSGTVEQIRRVVSGGCRWVQIRMKDAADADVAAVVQQVKDVCNASGTVLLLDDRVELAARLGTDGVHLGKNDMSPLEARHILGREAIIGSTANTLEDVEAIAALGATDYIGLGPFRFTTTKKNLSPVLGLDGYSRILAQMSARKIELPVVAIGGITPDDIPPIMAAGVSGIAVSGVITRSSDPSAEVRKLINQIYK